MMPSAEILVGDCLEHLRKMPESSVHCCVTSPPYWGLRDYGHAGQIGLESTPEAYTAKMVEVFREVRRVLRGDGTLWMVLGDSYAGVGRGGNPEESPFRKQATNAGSLVSPTAIPSGLKPKDLCGIPWRVAFALQADGWWLRQDIIWAKPNPMPESVTDRCTKAHEYVFLLSKSDRYHYDQEALKEPAIYCGLTGQDESGYKDAQTFNGKHHKTDKQRGHSRRHAGFNDRWDAMPKEQQCGGYRNRRSVWTIATQPYPEAHFATYPEELPRLCIMAGCPLNGTVLDPFAGSGTTGKVALELGRNAVLIELNPAYDELCRKRCDTTPGFPNLTV